MNVMVGSVNVGEDLEKMVEQSMAAALDTPPALWLPAHTLNCYEANAQLRSWLLTPGLLTHRVRDLNPKRFALRVVGEYADGADHLREIELISDGRVWIFAQTRVPAATLAANKWLAKIGGTSLGEALAAHGAVTRSDFDYTQLSAEHPLIVRSFNSSAVRPRTLWVRRSTFELGNAPFYLHEVFMPVIGTVAT